MKLKGISAVEQHVEKFVLIGVSIVFLGALAMQFLVQPNLIKVDTAGRMVPPERAFEEVEKEAHALLQKLRTTDVELPDVKEVDLAEGFRESLSAPVSPTRSIIALGPSVTVQGAAGADIGHSDAPLAAFRVPAPAQPAAVAYASTIHPIEVRDHPELAAILPQEQPFDRHAVSIETRFDGRSLASAFAADPDGPEGVRAMPSNWWRNQVEIVGTRMERQELGSDGTWSGPVAVPPMPGRLDLTATETPIRGVTDLTRIVEDARRMARHVQRPEYYRLVAGTEWYPPSEAAARESAAANKEEVDRVMAERAEIKDKLAGLDEDLKRAPDPSKKDEENQRDRPPPSGRGGRGGRGVPGGGDALDRRGEDEKKEKQLTRPQIEGQIRKAEQELDRNTKRLADLGVTDPDRGEERQVNQARARNQPEERVAPMLDNPSVQVWTHDVTVEPGKTYRYRASVVVNNPVFARGASLVEDQKSMAAEPFLVGAMSGWSEPVTVDEETYFFVTSASEPDKLGLGGARAGVEVYHFYYGYYREGSASLEPGDVIDTKLALSKPETRPMFDLDKLGGPPQQGGGQAGRPGPGRGDHPSQEDRGRGALGAERGGPGRNDEDPSEVQLPTGASPGPTDLTVALPIALLDVSTVPGVVEGGFDGASAKVLTQAYLRMSDGTIAVRVPAAETSSNLYQRVARSSREGIHQGVPPEPVKKEKQAPIREEERQEDTGGKGGSGGGGG